MEDKEKVLFESLQNDMAIVGNALKEVSKRVIDEKISEYPVFIASQDWVDFGRLLFDRDEVQLNWYFFATIIEDFVKKGLITEEKLHSFTRTFGDPLEKACIFTIFEEEARFIFVPYDLSDN